MLYLRTGLPGASKTLNTLKEVIEDSGNVGRPIYYNNIKLLMLDFEVCSSFAGWFYGVYLPDVPADKKPPLTKILLKVHASGDLASVSFFPHLEQLYDAWLTQQGHISLWLWWVSRLYPDSRRSELRLFLDSVDKQQVTVESLKRFNLDFRRFDKASDWYLLERNAVIIIDECQQTFPPRAVGARVPQHCSEFETHRHKGWDVHLITQDAKLLDVHVRRLAGTHVHYYNPFRSASVTRYQADKCFDPDDFFSKSAAQRSVIRRDKDFYGLYWSADVHTHKFKMPPKLLLLPLLIVVCGALAYSAITGAFLSDSMKPSEVASSDPLSSPSSKPLPSADPFVSSEGKFLPFTSVLTSTPIGSFCSKITYAGNELLYSSDGQMIARHYFNCEIHQDKEEKQKKSEDEKQIEPPSIVLDLKFLRSLGFEFKYSQQVPQLIYSGVTYVFPSF